MVKLEDSAAEKIMKIKYSLHRIFIGSTCFSRTGDQVKIDFYAPQITEDSEQNVSDLSGHKAIEIKEIEIVK